jgi:hypothetical protein
VTAVDGGLAICNLVGVLWSGVRIGGNSGRGLIGARIRRGPKFAFKRSTERGGGRLVSPFRLFYPRTFGHRTFPVVAHCIYFKNSEMVKYKTVGVSYGVLRNDCLKVIRPWPGC